MGPLLDKKYYVRAGVILRELYERRSCTEKNKALKILGIIGLALVTIMVCIRE